MPGLALANAARSAGRCSAIALGIGGHAQMPLDAARKLHHLALERMQRCVQRADVAQQGAPGFGGLDAARAALEQRHAESRLEVGQALAGRRQRQALAFSAAGDAAGVGNGQHEVQGGEVETHGAQAGRTGRILARAGWSALRRL